jgi:hypothetical protein
MSGANVHKRAHHNYLIYKYLFVVSLWLFVAKCDRLRWVLHTNYTRKSADNMRFGGRDIDLFPVNYAAFITPHSPGGEIGRHKGLRSLFEHREAKAPA